MDATSSRSGWVNKPRGKRRAYDADRGYRWSKPITWYADSFLSDASNVIKDYADRGITITAEESVPIMARRYERGGCPWEKLDALVEYAYRHTKRIAEYAGVME